MSITLEQRLLSAKLRLLMDEPWPEEAEAANTETLVQMVASMAGGDVDRATAALQNFSGQLDSGSPCAQALVELFQKGLLDVAGVKDTPDGPDLLFTTTPTGEDVLQ